MAMDPPATPISVDRATGHLQRTPSGPTPRRLSEIQGSTNISRLERSAEEISHGGSDIAWEIRRMNEAEKRRSHHSRKDSSEPDADIVHALPTRVSSSGARRRTSSYGNSILDINGAARYGGYSPAAYVTSPVGLSRTASWTHLTEHRTASSSTSSSRPVVGPKVEPLQEGRPLDSPLGPSTGSFHSQEQQTSRRMSQSSFAKQWDTIAEQIGEDVYSDNDMVVVRQPGQLTVHTVPDRPTSTDTFQEAQLAFKDFDGVHFSPETEEFVELDEHGHEIRRISARSSSGSLLDAAMLMRSPQRQTLYGAPPPEPNMVYYPAPVPRMLNLPKRLSQLPAANVQARRRTQLLSELQPGARQSVAWHAPVDAPDNSHDLPPDADRSPNKDNRRSMLNQRMSVANLPPQLRASVYFEHQSIPQDVEVKSESAVATLDSILNASATAPVNAFTDHPFAGDVRRSVYASGNLGQRRSTILVEPSAARKSHTRRKSSVASFFRRNSTILEDGAQRPASHGDWQGEGQLDGEKAVRKRRSVMSLGDELEGRNRRSRLDLDGVAIPASEGRLSGTREEHPDEEFDDDEHRSEYSDEADDQSFTDEEEYIPADHRDEEDHDDIDDADVVYAAPSTLLAELQVRKAQQKSRSRTAATAFPNGMHSTLLQLDAVEEISKKNRRIKRIDLAWEDPTLRQQDSARDKDDDEVPLGMLYHAKANAKNRGAGDGRDYQRPMGLMERRELEDSEPLSSRRNRLRGISPPRPVQRMQRASTQPLPQSMPQGNDADPLEEGESLGQRARRMKTKDALDTAISDVAPVGGERPLSTFTDDVLSHFGGLNVEEKPTGGDAAATADRSAPVREAVEETLGQRRARLQREREAAGISGDASPARPMLKSSQSLANLLAHNPVGIRPTSSKNAQPAQGTLLHTSAQFLTKHKQDLVNQNTRSASMLNHKPLVNPTVHHSQREVGGLLSQQGSRPRNGGYAGGAFNNSGLPTAMSTPGMIMHGAGGGYFPAAQQTMPQFVHQPQMMSPMAYPMGMDMTMPGAFMGYPQAMMMGGQHFANPQMMAYNGAPMAMGMNSMNAAPGMDASQMATINPNQRNAIDRWRMDVGS